MWKILHASVEGTSHASTSTPCEDACGYREAAVGPDEFLLVAIADGAGSAKFGGEGAQRTVQTWLDVATVELNISGEIDETAMIDIAESCHTALANHAKTFKNSIGDYACTLLAAVIGPKTSIFFQIGDGVWVGDFACSSEAITWPFQGEYAGEVIFLTSKARGDHYQIHHTDTPSSFAGTTDGLERLVLDFKTESAADGFFQPIWKTLREGNPSTLVDGLIQFLNSKRVCERTDDDKTLFLATRNDGS